MHEAHHLTFYILSQFPQFLPLSLSVPHFMVDEAREHLGEEKITSQTSVLQTL
jgi:hypothetical protein